MDIELRKTLRKKPQQLIYVELGQDNGGMMRDLCENGMGFRSMGPLQRGAKVPFSFSFSASELVKGEAELIWTDPEGRAGGLHFVDAERVRGQIRNWLAREESPVIVEDRAEKTTFAEKESTFEELRKELRGETSPAVATTAPVEAETLAVEAKDEESAPAMPIAASTEILPRPPAQAPLQKEINFGLEPLAPPLTPLEGTLTKTRWVENVTLGWVVTAMVILTLLAAGFVYHRELGRSLIWLGAKIAGPEQTNTTGSQPVQPTEAGTENLTSDTASGATDSTVQPDTSREKLKSHTTAPVLPSTGTGNAKPETPVPGTRQTRAQDTNQGNVGNALTNNEENGRFELQQALKILRGEVPSGNISDALQLLWVAVERGNSDAEVALADLYRTGGGVPQNCDQTRVLLNAAAKKGNRHAKARLDEIAQTGCP